ncbi:unnamed protein product, partial [Rotaria sp. Silwood2]
MKIIVILIITLIITSVNAAQQNPSNVLYGLFSNSNETHVYYGLLDLNTSQFDIFSSLNINDVGNP